MRKIGILIVLLTILAVAAMAQQPAGSVRGKITSSDGKPAEGVSILVKNKKHNALSDKNGYFEIKNLPPADYTLSITLVGHETVEKDITVTAGTAAELDFELQLNTEELAEVVVLSNNNNSVKSNRVSNSLRLQTPLIETPQNIQVVTAKSLADQQIISMSDGLIRNVSGAVRLEHWGDMYTNISMRGTQIQAFRNGFNVVASYWGPLTEDMSFVDHIEFVKGPAGFMLANGDPSGLYNVVTKKPTGQTKGAATLTMGSFDLFRSTLDLDGKLSKNGKLLYRLNLAAQNKGSFRQFEYNDRYSIAPVISYQVDDKTKLTAEYTYQFAKMSNVGSFYVFAPQGYAVLPRNFTLMAPGLEPTKINDQTFLVNLQHEINKDWKLTAQASYLKYGQHGSSSWPTSVAADGKMIRNVGIWDAASDMTLGQFFINGNATTGAVSHRILGGVDVGAKNYIADWGQSHDLDTANGGEFDPAAPYYGAPVNGYPVFDRSTSLEERAAKAGGLMDQRYTGIYVQDELGFFNKKLRLTLAGRYTTISQSAWGGAPDKANRFTPRVGLSYSVSRDLAVYGLYDQAFVPQSGRLANGGDVKPITGNNQEIGIKKDWANGAWNTTIAVYRILKENELTADPNQPPSSGYSIVLGQKKAQGIEFDLRGRLAPGLTLVANYAYTEAKVSKVAKDVTAFKVGDLVPGYSTHTANAWLTYKIMEGKLQGLGASGGFTWLGDRRTDSWSESDIRLPDYFKLDGGLFWEGAKMRVSANVFNILDKYIYSGSYYSYLNAFYWQADPPRNFRFEIAYKF